MNRPSLLEAIREAIVLEREIVLLLREGVHVVREKRAAENVALRERVDQLEARLRACEERCRLVDRPGKDAS